MTMHFDFSSKIALTLIDSLVPCQEAGRTLVAASQLQDQGLDLVHQEQHQTRGTVHWVVTCSESLEEEHRQVVEMVTHRAYLEAGFQEDLELLRSAQVGKGETAYLDLRALWREASLMTAYEVVGIR